MTTPDPEQIAAGLSEASASAVRHYSPHVWYGQSEPTWRASFSKGKLCTLGILEHDGDYPTSKYRLTPLGLAVRNIVKDQPND